jgi:FAD binding domain
VISAERDAQREITRPAGEHAIPITGTPPLPPSLSPIGCHHSPTAWRAACVPGNQNRQWDEIFDVAVVGSGGGALTAALLAAAGGATVVIVEKDEFIGGTTAVSGGDMWIPNNRFIADSDSREDAIAYITRLADGRPADRPAAQGAGRPRRRGADPHPGVAAGHRRRRRRRRRGRRPAGLRAGQARVSRDRYS